MSMDEKLNALKSYADEYIIQVNSRNSKKADRIFSTAGKIIEYIDKSKGGMNILKGLMEGNDISMKFIVSSRLIMDNRYVTYAAQAAKELDQALPIGTPLRVMSRLLVNIGDIEIKKLYGSNH